MTTAPTLSIQKTTHSRLSETDFNNLEFGKYISDHMVMSDWAKGTWTEPTILPFGELRMTPAILALHYGQAIFEGMKAFRMVDGNINIFRPQKHHERLLKSLERMCMPEISYDMFIQSLHALIELDHDWVPRTDGSSLYIRPVVFASESRLGVKVADQYKFVVMTSPVGPYYNKPSQEGIYQHFCPVADASPVPIILYNVPGRTASNISAETTLRLAAHANIIGIKEASGNLEQCMKIAKEKPAKFLLISGDDLLTLPISAVGGAGVISVLANAYPVVFRKLKEHTAAGNLAKARAEIFKLLEINGPMYEEGNPVGVKHLLQIMGVCGHFVRLPLVPASVGLQKRIAALAEQVR